MKILYIASNPKDENSLALEREMTELQRELMHVDKLGSIVFRALPNLEIDRLPTILKEFAPDLVHISAHGSPDGLMFSSGEQGRQQFVKTDQLVALFRAVVPRPRLVYLSACSAENIADQLRLVIPFTIGTTAEISNEAARRSALKFYEWLGRGSSIQEAFNVSKPLLEIADQNEVSSKLFVADRQDPAKETFVEIFRMLASFTKLEDAHGRLPTNVNIAELANRWGDYEVEIGLAGCPADTYLVVLFTTDETFVDQNAIDNGEDTLESQITWVRRAAVTDREIWIEDEPIQTNGDAPFYASVVTSKGQCFTVSSKLSDALTRYYFDENWHPLQPKYQKLVSQSIDDLVRHAGPRRSRTMRPTLRVPDGKPSKKTSAKPTRRRKNARK
jgi:hypothetical protein